MLEVKFQAYDREYGQMYTNAYPFEHLVYVEMPQDDPEVQKRESSMHKVNGKWFYFLLRKDVDLRQYTGLKDVYKQEIYKGDILAATEMGSPVIGFVDWGYDSWEVKSDKFSHGEGYEYGTGRIYSSLYQVAGNVYEHIELLPEVLRKDVLSQ